MLATCPGVVSETVEDSGMVCDGGGPVLVGGGCDESGQSLDAGGHETVMDTEDEHGGKAEPGCGHNNQIDWVSWLDWNRSKGPL